MALIVIFVLFIITMNKSFNKQIHNARLEVEDDVRKELYPKMFRVGDPVYIKNKDYDPKKVYYLLERYNGDRYWYVGFNPGDAKRSCLGNGVSVFDMSRDPLPECPCCNRTL